jgi:hypothetical protein
LHGVRLKRVIAAAYATVAASGNHRVGPADFCTSSDHILYINTDISITEICLNIFILTKSIIDRRKYIFFPLLKDRVSRSKEKV